MTHQPVTYESHWSNEAKYTFLQLDTDALPADELQDMYVLEPLAQQSWPLTDPNAPPRQLKSDFHVAAYLDPYTLPTAVPTSSTRPSNIPGDWPEGRNYLVSLAQAIRTLTDVRLTYYTKTGSSYGTVQVDVPLDLGLPALESMTTEDGRKARMTKLQEALRKNNLTIRQKETGQWQSGVDLLSGATLVGVSLDGLPEEHGS